MNTSTRHEPANDLVFADLARPIDRESPLPVWAQVERDVRSIIDLGLAPGSQLPTESELTGIYGVSRITIRQAFAALSTSGYVERRHGIGTFVLERPPVIQHDVGLMSPWRDRFRSAGSDAKSLHLQDADMENEPYELDRMLTGDERRLKRLHLKRLHFVNDVVVGITDSWALGDAADALIGLDLIDGSVSKTLGSVGFESTNIDHILEVRGVNSAEAVLLDAPIDAQVFVDWSVGRDDVQAIETARTVWLGSRVRLHYVTDER